MRSVVVVCVLLLAIGRFSGADATWETRVGGRIRAKQVTQNRCCDRVAQAGRAACAKLMPATVEQFKASADQCYGAVGAGCTGVVGLAPAKPAPATMGANRVSLWMSVGSIYHDTCCAMLPFGMSCHDSTRDVLGSWPDACACKMEWVKARLNSISNPSRQWQVTMNQRSDLSTIRREDRLRAWLPNAAGVWMPLGSGSLVNNEVMQNLAPGCTPLDCPANDPACAVGFYAAGVRAGDSQFCASGMFFAIEDPPGGLVAGLAGLAQDAFGVRAPRFGRCTPAPGKTQAPEQPGCAAQINEARAKLRPGPVATVAMKANVQNGALVPPPANNMA